MNPEHEKKLDESNEKITIEDILKAIKQKNDNTNIQKELETRLRKITHLNEDELKVLNNIVSGYFDFAEIQAIRHNRMYMKDYIKQLDSILSNTGEKLLTGSGKVSHEQALEKAETEYKKYQIKTLSPVEEAYLDTIKKSNKSNYKSYTRYHKPTQINLSGFILRLIYYLQ